MLVGPYLRQHLVSGDDAVALLNEIDQDLEDLRAERHTRPTPEEFIALNVEGTVAKDVLHRL
jgi:hypothetical protein